jgi:hypothetical protein
MQKTECVISTIFDKILENPSFEIIKSSGIPVIHMKKLMYRRKYANMKQAINLQMQFFQLGRGACYTNEDGNSFAGKRYEEQFKY